MVNLYFVLSVCSTMRRVMKELLSKTKKKKKTPVGFQTICSSLHVQQQFFKIICADSHEPRDVGRFSSTH